MFVNQTVEPVSRHYPTCDTLSCHLEGVTMINIHSYSSYWLNSTTSPHSGYSLLGEKMYTFQNWSNMPEILRKQQQKKDWVCALGTLFNFLFQHLTAPRFCRLKLDKIYNVVLMLSSSVERSLASCWSCFMVLRVSRGERGGIYTSDDTNFHSFNHFLICVRAWMISVLRVHMVISLV